MPQVDQGDPGQDKRSKWSLNLSRGFDMDTIKAALCKELAELLVKLDEAQSNPSKRVITLSVQIRALCDKLDALDGGPQ